MLNTECINLRGASGKGDEILCSLHGSLGHISGSPSIYRAGWQFGHKCDFCRDAQPLVFPSWEIVVAMTTVVTRGRQRSYATGTYESLCNLKAEHGPLVRTDGDRNQDLLGPFCNFYLTATELALRWPHASAYLICQDDVLLDPSAIEKVKAAWTPADLPHLVSLYRPEEIEPREGEETHMICVSPAGKPLPPGQIGLLKPDWFRTNRGWESPGACCYLFSGAGLRDLLTDSLVLWHRRHGPTQGMRCLDAVVGLWASQDKIGPGIWYHEGELAKHIGEVSTRGTV